MKIGRVFATFQTDFKYTEHYLAKELSLDGHSTVFITSDKYPNSWKNYLKGLQTAGYYKFRDYEVYRLTSFFPFEKAIFKNWIKLKKLLIKSDFDVLHLSGVGTFSSIITLLLLSLNKGSIPVVIISDHTDSRTHKREGIFANIYHLIFKLMYKFLEKQVSTVITFNKVGINILTKRYNINPDKFIIIPLGYDQDTYFYNPELKNIEDKFIIGYAGKIDSKKKINKLIDAIKESKYSKEIKLILVGINSNDPYCRKIINISNESGLDIELRPFASSKNLADFYNYIDLAVYPGGISITTIEASGCGTPVIIYKSIDDLSERVSNGRGKLFLTEEELISYIEDYYLRFLNKSIDNKSIAKYTSEMFSWARLKNKYLEVYRHNYER